MEDVKGKSNNMASTSVDTLPVLSLLGKLDPYWKSQLLVEYSKDIHTCMIIDDLLHDGSYSILDGVIYNHGRIFLSRASNLKEKLLQWAYEEFCFNHEYSMNLNKIILKSYYWEGFEEEIYQHCQRCMNLVEMGQQHSSVEELIQPSLSPLEGGDISMHHSKFMGRTIGEEYAHVKQVYFFDCMHSFTMFI